MYTIILVLCLQAQGIETPAMMRGGVWLPRLGGTITDGGGAVDFETNIDLRRKETIPVVEFKVKPVEDVVMSLSFFDFSVSGSGTYAGNDTYGAMVMASGNRWSASTEMQSVGFEAAWEVWQPYKAKNGTTLSFAPVAGLRWFGVTTRLENRTTSLAVEHQNSWIALQGGLEMDFRWEMDSVTSMIDSMGISAQGLAGSMFGGDGGSMWTAQAGVSLYFNSSTALFFGYRLQELNADDGNYTFDAGLQGLYLGGELRF
jgi:hypothetical protein